MHAPDPGTSFGYWSAIAAQRYYTLLLQRLGHHDIDRWFYALLTIADSDQRLSQQELAERLHIDKVTMLRAIDMLSAKGYVERVSCPNDRRKHHIRLLPKAQPVVKDIRRAYAELNEMAFAGMDAKARATFIRQLNGTLERMDTNGMKPARINYTKRLPK